MKIGDIVDNSWMIINITGRKALCVYLAQGRTRKSWGESKQDCEKIGGRLPTIDELIIISQKSSFVNSKFTNDKMPYTAHLWSSNENEPDFAKTFGMGCNSVNCRFKPNLHRYLPVKEIENLKKG